MSTPNSRFSHWDHERDPAAVRVEARLRELARDAGLEVQIHSSGPGNVAVSFGALTSNGENCDIAILRLASALLDDRRFGPALVCGLGDIVGDHTLKA